MLYILHIRSLSVIASQMYFVHASSFHSFCGKKKEKGSGPENSGFIIQQSAHLSDSSWQGY